MKSFQLKRAEKFKIFFEKLLDSESGCLIELIVDVESIKFHETLN